jgi:signal transduction histidine kinase
MNVHDEGRFRRDAANSAEGPDERFARALGFARSLTDVGATLVGEIASRCSAICSVVYGTTSRGLELLAHDGLLPQRARALALLGGGAPFLLTRAIDTKRPAVARRPFSETNATLASNAVQPKDIGTAIALPLLAFGHVVGALEVALEAGTGAEDDVVTLLAALSSKAALALDKLRDGRAETRAHERLTLLAELSSALSTPHDYGSTLETLAAVAVPRYADMCIVDELDDRGGIVVRAYADADPGKGRIFLEHRRRFPPDPTRHPIARIVRGGRAALVADFGAADIRALAHNEEHERLVSSAAPRSIVCVPLVARGRALGALSLCRRSGRDPFTTDDIPLAEEFAARAALLADNARLLDREREARRDAERAEHRLSFLLETSGSLASSLDVPTTLMHVVERVVPHLADGCVVALAVADGGYATPLVAHRDEPRERALRSAVEARALRGDRAFDEAGFFVETIPLATARGPVGDLMLVCDGRPPDSDARTLAREIARRAAPAIENAQHHRAIQELNRLKDEFLATVSHELRTPLTAIMGWARMLRLGQVDAGEHDHALEVIERNAQAQAQIVEDILDVSRAITGKLQLEMRPFDLRDVVDCALETVAPAARSKGVGLAATVAADARDLVGDVDRLKQVLWNLLSNAVKFTPRNGQIRLTAQREDDSVLLRVEDQGMGIARDFLPFVFERFRQAESAKTRAHGGLGLGLAIVKHIVELHGGSVSAASDGPNRGSVFSVRLPLRAHAGGPPVSTRAVTIKANAP